MRSAACRFHCSSVGSRAASRGPPDIGGCVTGGAEGEVLGAAAGADAAGGGATGDDVVAEPHPASTRADATAAYNGRWRFSIVQHLASRPTVHARPDAGSKYWPSAPLTVTEPP